MADARLLVLVSLSDGPKHGYAIQADVNSYAAVHLGRAPFTGPSTHSNETASSKRSRAISGDAPIGSRTAGASSCAISSKISIASVSA